jgi:hypothetical protein
MLRVPSNNTAEPLPNYLFVVLVIYCGASLLHFVHNAEFLDDYPNLPDWLSRSLVYMAWLAVTTLGALGIVLVKLGFRLYGLLLIAVYAGQGFAGLDHYWVAPLAAHSFGMNASIWLEVAAASALLVATFIALYSFARRPTPLDA